MSGCLHQGQKQQLSVTTETPNPSSCSAPLQHIDWGDSMCGCVHNPAHMHASMCAYVNIMALPWSRSQWRRQNSVLYLRCRLPFVQKYWFLQSSSAVMPWIVIFSNCLRPLSPLLCTPSPLSLYSLSLTMSLLLCLPSFLALKCLFGTNL